MYDSQCCAGGGPPGGSVDSVSVTGSVVTVSGWALDPEPQLHGRSTEAHIYVNGACTSRTANRPRPDVNRHLVSRVNTAFAASVPLNRRPQPGLRLRDRSRSPTQYRPGLPALRVRRQRRRSAPSAAPAAAAADAAPVATGRATSAAPRQRSADPARFPGDHVTAQAPHDSRSCLQRRSDDGRSPVHPVDELSVPSIDSAPAGRP